MEQDKTPRMPQQKRSEKTREKILNTALELFCKNGYYKTSTNEIAKAAGISVGHLYFYFPNKKAIFLEILDRYHRSFMQIHKTFLKGINDFQVDPEIFIKKVIEAVIKNHENAKELNREILILSFSDSEVADVLDKQREQTEKAVLSYLKKYESRVKVRDLEAAAAVVLAMISSIVDQIAFSKNKVSRERLLAETANAVEAYLLGNID